MAPQHKAVDEGTLRAIRRIMKKYNIRIKRALIRGGSGFIAFSKVRSLIQYTDEMGEIHVVAAANGELLIQTLLSPNNVCERYESADSRNGVVKEHCSGWFQPNINNANVIALNEHDLNLLNKLQDKILSGDDVILYTYTT